MGDIPIGCASRSTESHALFSSVWSWSTIDEREPKFGLVLEASRDPNSDAESRCIFLDKGRARWNDSCLQMPDVCYSEVEFGCQDLPSAMLVLDYQQLLAASRSGSTYDQRNKVSVGEPGCDGGAGERDWGLADACMEAMGPNGDGFVAVRGMKNYASLRDRLLRHAQKLALMPTRDRVAVLKEHGLGTDVPLKDPGRLVSSFAAQLRFGAPVLFGRPPGVTLGSVMLASSDDCGDLKTCWSSDGDSLSDLGSLFKQLGMCMVEVGLLVARLCDAARSHGTMREARLEQAILESGTAKGRLIHYHSFWEQEMVSSLQKDFRKGRKQNKSGGHGGRKPGITTDFAGAVSTWWQQWHRDYGIFTVITSPLFLKPTGPVATPDPNEVATERSCACLKDTPMSRMGLHNPELPKLNSCQQPGKPKEKPRSPLNSTTIQECPSPDGHSSLVIMDSHGQATSLVIPSDDLIVQVGEAAQLLCGGELIARAHCVMRPSSARDVSRETMAVFLQPAWDRRMSLPPEVPLERALEEPGGAATDLETHIPRLASRWRDGCTFAELSKETTRQYYGADGQQSRRLPS